MRIGIFDSGLGGLLITQSLISALPQYDYLYLGDTKRVPYGNRSQEAVYQFTVEAVDYLFKNDCQLIIVACNTASAEALHRVQTEYLPKHYPERRVLGIIVPTVERLVEVGAKKIGVLATSSTVASGTYPREVAKISPDAQVIQQASPLLVPLIEYGGLQWSDPIIRHYVTPLLEEGVDTLLLGCTHYVAIKDKVRSIASGITVVAQDELIAESFSRYLDRHPEHEEVLSRDGKRAYHVTDLNESTFESLKVFEDDMPALVRVELPTVTV